MDELNSAIGVAAAYCREEGGPAGQALVRQFPIIQSRLLDAGTAVRGRWTLCTACPDAPCEGGRRPLPLGSGCTQIATPLTSSSEAKIERASFPTEVTEQLEKWIDQMASCSTASSSALP